MDGHGGGRAVDVLYLHDYYIPSIYLSILSHSVFPVDKRYLMCDCRKSNLIRYTRAHNLT
jgi:hypothetical protein